MTLVLITLVSSRVILAEYQYKVRGDLSDTVLEREQLH